MLVSSSSFGGVSLELLLAKAALMFMMSKVVDRKPYQFEFKFLLLKVLLFKVAERKLYQFVVRVVVFNLAEHKPYLLKFMLLKVLLLLLLLAARRGLYQFMLLKVLAAKLKAIMLLKV